MAIQRVYQSGWSVGEKLTPAQTDALDQNFSYAVDKRSAQSDVIGALLIATGAGRALSTVQTGPDAVATFYANGYNSIVRIPTLTAARLYMLGSTGAVNGDRIKFYVEGTGSNASGASGYVDIAIPQWTGVYTGGIATGVPTGVPTLTTTLFRLGQVNSRFPSNWAEGDSAEFIFTEGTWKLMYGAGPGMRHVEFTESATWVCPPGVFEIMLIGYGGGGGGANGGGASIPVLFDSTIPILTAGGGGGGGSQLRTFRVAVVPGHAYTITIGAGGLPNLDGGDTTFAKSSVPSTFLAVFVGAERGMRGGVATMLWIDALSNNGLTGGYTGTFGGVAFGGAGVRPNIVQTDLALLGVGTTLYGIPSMARIDLSFDNLPTRGPDEPGSGGPGITPNIAVPFLRSGNFSVQGYAGGTAGMHGPEGTRAFGEVSAGRGGGGGGGGGGGPGGIGGAGGMGGDGNQWGGFPGNPGSAARENTGAGGGGGGGGSVFGFTSDVGVGGAGGTGGSGKLAIVYTK